MRAPALIVVGKVVRLRDKLNRTEERMLSGKRYLVPRIGKEYSERISGLRTLGAFVQELQIGEFEISRIVEAECADYEGLIQCISGDKAEHDSR